MCRGAFVRPANSFEVARLGCYSTGATRPGGAAMPSLNLRKFSDPDWLRSIAPARLAAFLSPWRDYLADRGLALPATGDAFDFDALARILMTPSASTPSDMVEALYLVQETDTDEDMDELLRAATARGLAFPDTPTITPAEVAMEVWRRAPHVLHARHAEVLALRQQRFDYFEGRDRRARKLPPISADLRGRIEATFDDWFEAHRRGRGCRLLVFRHGRLAWILIRHGLPMRREASHKDDGSAGTEFFRPRRHDVLVYDDTTGEIGVHADTQGERKLYLRTLGEMLFGDPDHFPQAKRFTLDPLVTYGADALACADVEGIEAVRLTEYRIFWGGKHQENAIHRARDLFAAMAERGRDQVLPREPSAVTFKVRFAESPRDRTVVIRAPASARYERNDDSELVERWLRARGFLLSGEAAVDDHSDAPALLENA